VLTAIAGSSEIFDRGFVTYSNEAKCEMIGVPIQLIQTQTEVSEQVARAMAEGALSRSRATIAVSDTGLAGPRDDKQVGLVCFGLAQCGVEIISERKNMPGDRSEIRVAAVAHAFSMLRARISWRCVASSHRTALPSQSVLASVSSSYSGGIKDGRRRDRPPLLSSKQQDKVMRSNIGWVDRVLAGAFVTTIALFCCSAPLASQICFYGNRKFSEGAKLSVACATARAQPTVCTVIVCRSGAWVNRDPPQCTFREGCPPRAPQ
jgi:nicotinamide-nucleotide amidase